MFSLSPREIAYGYKICSFIHNYCVEKSLVSFTSQHDAQWLDIIRNDRNELELKKKKTEYENMLKELIWIWIKMVGNWFKIKWKERYTKEIRWATWNP